VRVAAAFFFFLRSFFFFFFFFALLTPIDEPHHRLLHVLSSSAGHARALLRIEKSIGRSNRLINRPTDRLLAPPFSKNRPIDLRPLRSPPVNVSELKLKS
jgi:hypothetical protein